MLKLPIVSEREFDKEGMDVNDQVTINLSHRQAFSWGAVGGLLSIAATYGLFDVDKVHEMINGAQPGVQISTYVIVSIVIVLVGALWARAHYPVRSALIAIQLGIIAPAAINALLSKAPDEPVDISAIYVPAIVSSAHASDIPRLPLNTQSGDKTGIVECVVKAAIKKPC